MAGDTVDIDSASHGIVEAMIALFAAQLYSALSRDVRCTINTHAVVCWRGSFHQPAVRRSQSISMSDGVVPKGVTGPVVELHIPGIR
jgi:hypothetical protein